MKARLTFANVRAEASKKGIVIEEAQGGYEYWNRKAGASTVGFARNLEDARCDMSDFTDSEVAARAAKK